MEQHAVPQDITGFKFKLVGDMTLKQFGELAGGAVIAYLFFASGWHPILRWPLTLTFGFLGFALAFLPVEERPLDIWIINFIKSIYQPTLFVWKKGSVQPAVATSPTVNLTVGVTKQPISQAPMPQLWPFPKEASPVKETAKEKDTVTQPGQPQPEKVPATSPVPPTPEQTHNAPPPSTPAPSSPLSIEDLQGLREKKISELEQAVKKLDTMTQEVKIDTFQAKKGPNIITVDDLALRRDEKKMAEETQLRSLLEENRKLVDQIETVKTRIQALAGMDTSQLKSQLDNLNNQYKTLSEKINSMQTQKVEPGAVEQSQDDSQVRIVDKSASRQTVISLTEVPNIINGVVTNDKNAPLDSTILVIKDKAGNSIRAMRTNQIGQFIASTPLENGTYFLEFERQGYIFDILEVTLNGNVLPPIEIHAKATN